MPDKRKLHAYQKPSMGGIPIFLGAAFALIVWAPGIGYPDLRFHFMALALIFTIGLRDDLVPLPASMKLVSQFIPAFIVIYWGNIELNSLYGFGGDTLFHPLITWFLSLFTLVVLTNSFNLIDGLDGLAGTISLIALLFFGIWFYIVGLNDISYVAFATVGSLLAFLLFNWQPSRIFMGDTGALLLGFFLTCAAIIFINTNYHLPVDNPLKFTATVSTAIAVMIIPFLDTLRVFILRISLGKSPFEADTNHLHHQLIRLGFSHAQTVVILASFNLLMIGLALILKSYHDIVLFSLMGLITVTFLLSVELTLRRRLKTQAQKTAV